MAKTITVTAAQRLAAQTLVERSNATGQSVRPGIRKIANAKVQRGDDTPSTAVSS